jgi:hypothetical protein
MTVGKKTLSKTAFSIMTLIKTVRKDLLSRIKRVYHFGSYLNITTFYNFHKLQVIQNFFEVKAEFGLAWGWKW